MAVVTAGGPENLCIAVLYLAPSGRAGAGLPSGLTVHDILPGMTLSGMYAARYGRGEACVSEFGVLEAYADWCGKSGFFVSNYFSDGRCAGGSGSARFDWDVSSGKTAFSVVSEGQNVISIKLRRVIADMPVNANFPLISRKGENVIFLQNQFVRTAGISASSIIIPPESPLSGIKLGLKFASAFWDSTKIVVREPEFARSRMSAADMGTPMGKCR